MKDPIYSVRERDIAKTCDRVKLRVYVGGEWREQEHYPAEGQTLRELVAYVQDGVKRHIGRLPGADKIIICIASDDAMVPLSRDYIPDFIQ